MYKISYFIAMFGLLGMATFHPEFKFQVAIFLLFMANALFLWI